MKKFALRKPMNKLTAQLTLGIAVFVAVTQAHAQMASKGKLLFKTDFKEPAVYGAQEKFGLPKTSVFLGSGYCVHEFRRLRIYEAKPNPKWTPPVGDTKPQADI